jgi:signal peptidase I
MKKFFKILSVILIIQYLIIQVSKVEGVSMQNSFYENDIIFVSLISYGIPVPFFNKYTIENIFDDDHIISGDGPERGDVITIKHLKDNEYQFYIKRMVAKDGDELLFTNNKMFLKTNKDFNNSSFVDINGSKWYVNPYDRQLFSNTFYTEFKNLIFKFSSSDYHGSLKPVYIEKFGDKESFFLNNIKYNAFYCKVPKNQFFVMGDNFNMSTDSREFGPVKYKDIFGKVLLTLRI